jgi:predicted RNase H-like HicB family nuclease
MQTMKFVYWQDNDMWLGYLEEYPDYMTQGKTIEELKENLADICKELSSGKISTYQNIAADSKASGYQRKSCQTYS